MEYNLKRRNLIWQIKHLSSLILTKKEVGVISKTDDGKMILNLNGFWGTIYSKK